MGMSVWVNRRSLLSGMCVVALGSATIGFAATPADAENDSGGLEDIFVTAQKRVEDSKVVPISVTALTSAQLAADHITSMPDLTRSLPDVSFSPTSGSGNGPGLSNIEIRGVSSQGGQATTGIYLDDISLSTPNTGVIGATELKFFDLERIEVLRGPQGTLFGAGSEGGTIRFISKQPQLDSFSGSVGTEVSTTQDGGINHTESAVVNLPLISDTLAVRIGGQFTRDAGYIDQISPYTGATVTNNINSEKDVVGKIAVKWKVNDALSITPSVFYQRTQTGDLDDAYATYVGSPLGSQSGPLPIDTTAKLVREPGVDRVTVSSFTVNYDTGLADLTSVSSYFIRQFDRAADATLTNSMGLGNYVVNPTTAPPCSGVLAAAPCQNLYNAVSNLPSTAYLDTSVSQVSEELRLTSKPYLGTSGELPFTWVTGAYYSSEIVKWTDDEYIPGLNAAYNAAGLSATDVNNLVGWSTTPPANSPGITFSSGVPFPNDEVFEAYRHYLTRQIALFGDVTAYVTPSFRLSAGARYLYAHQEFDRSAGTYWNGNYVLDTPPTITSYALTPKFSLDWDITANDTVYSTISKGYRLGDVNRPVPLNTCIVSGTVAGTPSPSCANSLSTYGYTAVPNAYKSDSLWNFEAGDKARLFSNRLSVDFAAFFIRWTNLQQTLVLPQGWDFVANTGLAHIYGVEWDVRGQVFPGLTLSTSGSVNHAVLVNSGLVLNAAGQPYTNAPVEGVPNWNGKVAAEYKRPLFAEVVGRARLSTSYTGESHGTFTPGTPDYYRSPYAISDLNIGADINALEVSLFATNLFDNRTIIQQPNIQLVQEVYRLSPRTIGISANYSF